MITPERLESYFYHLSTLPLETRVSIPVEGENRPIDLADAFERTLAIMVKCHRVGGKTIIIGNGGSAAIASHMAIDFTKNGGIRTVAFNDASSLTCTANDFGYVAGFQRMLEMYADPDDVIIAISSSGKSPNILNAVQYAKKEGHTAVTFSGFKENNKLRTLGDVNFYVNAESYGFVEVSHLALLHAILDLSMEAG